MEVPENRKWMDRRLDQDKNITEEFKEGCLGFVNFVLEKDKENIESEENIESREIRCPCKICKCLHHHPPDMVMVHLCRKGFMSNYYHWTNHGEPIPPIPPVVVDHSYYGSSGRRDMFDNYEQLRIYKWLPEHEAEIKKSFDHKVSDGYSNAMYRVRKKMDAGTWIPKKNRDELEQKWADEDWKAKAIINRNNRTSFDGSLHTGGSIPTTEHYKRLKNSSDETPTCWDLFEKTHKMKGETPKWVSSKAEKIINEYESRILERDSQEALGDGVCSEQSDNNIFLEVVGGVGKKKRIFGLGPEDGNHIPSSKQSMGIPVSEYMQMKTAFSNLTAENQSLKEQVGGLLATQEKMLKFMETYFQNHPRPPSPPLANEDDQQNDNDYYDEELDC